ncbi:MAG: HNH endonuclease [Actinomycetota bacterium]|nr:HNH endonuclease [Actinomycetota bacterium]
MEQAIVECDRLGDDKFRSTYGFGPAKGLVLVRDGREYDSKAIIGVAHGFATGTFLRSGDFSGGLATAVRKLQELGFDARDMRGLARASTPATFGAVPGQPPGTTYESRKAASDARVHRPVQAGICGTLLHGAESIVVSGGYEDDEDLGDLIVYTGHGEQNRHTRQQTGDQSFEVPVNAALVTSKLSGISVRVIRGAYKGSQHAPASGYRYDGLFRVVDAWQETGRSGFKVCRYKLVKADTETGRAPDEFVDAPVPNGSATPGRRQSTIQRVVQSTRVSRYVKEAHDDTCQACQTRLIVGGRGYSEGAHIRPLGKGHNGPDVAQNVLCLCPNCHVLFDNGALLIDGDMNVWVNGAQRGKLVMKERHFVAAEHLAYHHEHYAAASEETVTPAAAQYER